MNPNRMPVKEVLSKLSIIMLVAAALLPLTFFFPPIDLTGTIAQAAYWSAESGGTLGIPLIALAMTGLLIGRTGLSVKQRTSEALIIVLALVVLLGAGAYLNEHLVKPVFAIHRPNITELSQNPSSTKSTLPMSAIDFYALPTKASRSEHLKKVLTSDIDPPMDEHVRSHWIHETGYSFPSGHSFSAMLFSTTFLALGLTYFSQARLWVFYLLVVWAVAVCYSRPILRVHSPTDICVGGFEGIVAGVLCFLLVRGMLQFFSPEHNLAIKPGAEISQATP